MDKHRYIESSDNEKIDWATQQIDELVKYESRENSQFKDYNINNYMAALEAYKAIINSNYKPKAGDIGIILPILDKLLSGEDLK